MGEICFACFFGLICLIIFIKLACKVCGVFKKRSHWHDSLETETGNDATCFFQSLLNSEKCNSVERKKVY